tara:strand:- start:12817 stop:13443 length:627 start_codon:yes stop_codon:yes gene_type:complete
MTTPTTINDETELSAVNTILGVLGQNPVTTLESSTGFTDPQTAIIHNILKECNSDVQNEGWSFNRENHVKFTPDPTTKHIIIPTNVLRIDSENPEDKSFNLIRRHGKLYDKVNHTFEFEDDISCNVVYFFEYEDIPSIFRRLITYRAAGRAAAQLVTNSQLAQFIQIQEQLARASCMEYECNQGDYNMLGFPDNTHYSTYKPYKGLQR